MSKKEKLLQKLCSKPKDFQWHQLVTLMEYHGFKASCAGGSHYWFDHVSGYSTKIPRPHPDGSLKSYQIDEAIDALKEVGVI